MLGFKPLPVEVVKAVDPQVRGLEIYCGALLILLAPSSNSLIILVLLKTVTALMRNFH